MPTDHAPERRDPRPAIGSAQTRAVVERELSQAMRAWLGWTLPAAGLTAMTASLQPEMSKEGSVMQAKLDLMPKEMLAAFGVERMDLADPISYLATNGALIALLGALFAGTLGATLVTKEEAFGTGEILFSLPVSRTRVVVSKIAAALLPVVLFDVVVYVGARGTYAAVGVDIVDEGLFASLFVGSALLHVSLFALALASTIRLRRPRQATPFALAIVFGLYGLGVVGALSESLTFVGALSPFRAVDMATIVKDGGLSVRALVLGLVSVAAIVVAERLFVRKDLHA